MDLQTAIHNLDMLAYGAGGDALLRESWEIVSAKLKESGRTVREFVETYEREHGCVPDVIDTWYAAIAFAESNRQPNVDFNRSPR